MPTGVLITVGPVRVAGVEVLVVVAGMMGMVNAVFLVAVKWLRWWLRWILWWWLVQCGVCW